jgi:arabinofuranosyltransferase
MTAMGRRGSCISHALARALTPTIALLGLLRAWDTRWLCDDAYISFRYAANLVAGAGLVWNPGELVEGYTNWLFTMLLAGGMALHADPAAIAHTLGLGSYALVMIGVARIERDGRADEGPVCWSVCMVAVMPDLSVWATGGLETMPVAALSVWIALLARPGDRARELSAGALGALLYLTRPDCALIAGMLLAAPWFSTSGARLARALRLLGPLALAIALASVARFAYYGDWLPNTYYAKSAHLPYWAAGLPYVGWFVLANYVLLGLLLLTLLSWRRRDLHVHLHAQARITSFALVVTAGCFTVYVARS